MPPQRVFGRKVGNRVDNEFPGPSGPGAQKVQNRVEKESTSGNFNSFSTFLTLLPLVQKVKNRVEKESKKLKKSCVFFTF